MIRITATSLCILVALLLAQRSLCRAEPPIDPDLAAKAPAFDPPQILIAASINDEGDLMLVEVRTIYIGFNGESYNHRSLSKIKLKNVGIFTVQGKRVSVDEARQQLAGKDTPIICSSGNTPLAAFYASMFVPKTLHFVFPNEAPTWRKIQEQGRPLR